METDHQAKERDSKGVDPDHALENVGREKVGINLRKEVSEDRRSEQNASEDQDDDIGHHLADERHHLQQQTDADDENAKHENGRFGRNCVVGGCLHESSMAGALYGRWWQRKKVLPVTRDSIGERPKTTTGRLHCNERKFSRLTQCPSGQRQVGSQGKGFLERGFG